MRSKSQISPNNRQEQISAAVSPKRTAPQAKASPLWANFFTSTTTISILIPCSNSWDTALGFARLLAIKYPLKTEEAPINGSDSGNILREITVRLSPKMVVPIKFAPKIIITDDITASKSVSRSELRKIFLQFFKIFRRIQFPVKLELYALRF